MQLTVAVVGAPHGLRGEVRLDVRTDDPERRLAVGATLETDPADAGPLEVTSTRVDRGSYYVRFAGAEDRTAVESLRGVRLVVETDEEDDEEDAWYPHELRGLRAEHVDGRTLGEVVDLRAAPGHDLLLVRETDGPTTPVPFVRALVPVVDVAAGKVVLDPPRGLLAGDPLPEDADETGTDDENPVDDGPDVTDAGATDAGPTDAGH
ncbi:ribosome maturation factor RimM [Georgenia sp. Z1344]|uniref:ribosome maturation factor RimM n=1 Tax=Georgenia sp. Z1344 TaxID=3416706 RepID=UPI003CEF38A5